MPFNGFLYAHVGTLDALRVGDIRPRTEQNKLVEKTQEALEGAW
jgi:hypothetical protein